MAKTTKKKPQNSARILTFTVRWLAICLLFGTSFNTRVNCQIERKRQQESFHKYQQLQYQIQQQQQQQYQREMQQQQQYYLQQQLKQNEQEILQPISLPLQSSDNDALHSPVSQMLRTGASLVVAADGSKEAGPNENYGIEPTQQITAGRNGVINGRKRKRRPADNNDDESKQYWHGHVDDDTTTSSSSVSGSSNANGNSREEANGNQKLRRRKQPAIREPLAALEKEQKLFEIRDKQRQGTGDEKVTSASRDKSYRRPYSQAKKEQETSSSSSSSSTQSTIIASANDGKGIDLKHILKNSGGMSLSEILQKKNLSLDDLLKGKQNALLALQTTAESPSNQKAENSKTSKTTRRTGPANILGGSNTSSERNSSGESNSSEDQQNGKNKLKFPTLNRIKLFGTSSRATATPLPGSIETATTKKREHINASSTTTTAKPSTTTRVPIYKKRAQQRSTLKPVLRLKVTPETPTTGEGQEIKETSIKKATLPLEDDYDFDFDDTTDDIDFKQPSTTVETTTRDHVSVMTKGPTPSSSSMMTTMRKASTTSTSSPTSKATTSSTTSIPTTMATYTSSRRYRYGARPKHHVRSKYKERFGESNLKSNSIELVDTLSSENTNTRQQQSNDSKETEDMENKSIEIDDLEDFFEETSRTPVTNKVENYDDDNDVDDNGDEDTTIESITPRVDRTHRYRTSNTANVPSTKSPSEQPLTDFDNIDDRTDLLELIEDRHSGNRLFKVLQQRNMTLDQLIEHRKRGSSQLHLATVVDENARSQFFPGQKVVLRDDIDIVTAFENFPHFNLLNLKSVKPDDIKTDSQGSSYFTSIVDIEPTDEIYKNGKDTIDGDGSIRGPMYNQQSPRTEKSLSFFPSWKTLALASLASTTKANPFFLTQPKLLLDESNSDESIDGNLSLGNETNISNEESRERKNFFKRINSEEPEDTAEAIENEVARAHDLLDLELSGHAFKRSPAASTMMKQQYNAVGSLYTNMPAGVRSAIAASAAIVLTSMATFLVIFVVCRLRQRKRTKTNYLRTYNSMKSKMPMTTMPAHTTTSLGKLSATSTSNSRRSSLRNSLVEDLITSGIGASEVSASQMNIATISANTNSRPNELLFPRRDNITNDNSNQAILKACTKNLLCGRRGSSLSGLSRCSYGGGGVGAVGSGNIGHNNGGFNSMTDSTSSLALSLRSTQNISSTKLNTMDPNSPEVQEYLFDNLRKSFN